MSYVYINSEPGVYTVGHYSPDGTWHADSDWNDRELAGARVRFLNGGFVDSDVPPGEQRIAAALESIASILEDRLGRRA